MREIILEDKNDDDLYPGASNSRRESTNSRSNEEPQRDEESRNIKADKIHLIRDQFCDNEGFWAKV